MESALLSRLDAIAREEPELPSLQPGQMASGGGYWQYGRRVGLRIWADGETAAPHTRDFIELVYQCRGRGAFRINDRPLELGEGELLLLGQNTLLEIPPQEEDARIVSFLIKPELFGDILKFLGSEQTPLREFLLRCLGQEMPYGHLHFRVGGEKSVENLMENLILHLLDSRESRRAIPMLTVGLLCMHLLDQTDKLTIGIKEQMEVLRVLQHIEANYAHASLTRAAEELHCDVSWLSREIRRRTGRTFTELVQERRLSQAAWMLRNTTQKVSDIAVSVGYENISYFHRIFAKRFGVSPKKYRDNP